MVTDWLIAIGTLLAVIAALIIAVFQDWLRSRFSRPKLEVIISISPPDCHKTILYMTSPPITSELGKQLYGTGLEADGYYFRIRIKNSGNKRAEYVEVYAGELTKQIADGSFKRVDSFLPMNLVWSHVRKAYLPAISPKMEKLCDLGHIVEPSKRTKFSSDSNTKLDVPSDQVTFSFDVEVISTTKGHIIGPGKYRIKILVGAANIEPVEKTLELNLPGQWHEDENVMLTEGISISIL